MWRSFPVGTLGLWWLATGSLVACSRGSAVHPPARPDPRNASPVSALPLGERSPELLAAWSRSDADWAEWVDPSTKHVRFIDLPARDNGKIRLEAIDWGGQGPALILLAGLGESGHIYNDLAPRLTDRFRVIALTRRGHGASSRADSSTCGLDTSVSDVAAVMDSLHLKRASLIGHSLAGAEITRFAARWPERTDRLVYLDASHDFAGIDSVLGANPAWPPQFKPPTGTARDTLNAARIRAKRYRFGYWSDALESAILRSPDSDEASDECILHDATIHPKEYRLVQAPALALTAGYTMQNWFFYLDPVADSVKWKGAERWLTTVLRSWLDAGHQRFRREMRSSRTIELEADHHLFNSHPARTLRELRQFLLAPAAP
jgi:non-heme chloroperoxidase